MHERAVIVLDEAVEDLEAGRVFYDSRERGVGVYFLDSLLSDIESLRLHAGIHPIHFGFHRALSKRFPFAIYYDQTDEFVRVAAILDMRRDPAWTREELGEREG
ncbi:MAG TPA: type II toxin-antitoxin system RelE/ParE family toxin [Opitutaceae bacterium]|nr:type II toxin-antitoxin system RelE/ParE family toxin [Opitutaceae bacterium]